MSPSPARRAVVVVPAHDEQARIDRCLRALTDQVGVDPGAYEVIVVLHRCSDATAAVVDSVAAASATRGPAPGPTIEAVVFEEEGGVGPARRLGMDLAAARLADDGLVATTDADTVVAPDWLAAQLRLVGSGAQAVGGHITLDPDEAAGLHPDVLLQRHAGGAGRLAAVRAAGDGPAPEHHFFGAASIGITAGAYRRVGGLPPTAALEDEALARALAVAGIPIVRSAEVRVVTSARRTGRAGRGLAVDLAVAEWRCRRSHRARDFADVDTLAASRRDSVSVVLPARSEAATIGRVVEVCVTLREAGLVDEVLVVDAASEDGTAEIARDAGATVHQQDELLASLGPCLGKGDAMWRAQAVATGDVLCFLDTDTVDFDSSFVVGILGPLLTDPGTAMSKGCFERPLRIGGVEVAGEGGRVTELAARPVLNLWFPELAGFDQPLAGEVAIRRRVMAELAVPVGYGVEIAMLIDVARRGGLDAVCQVDLGRRRNRHQALRELSAMAYAVLAAAAARLPALEGGPPPGPLLLPGPTPGARADVRQVAVVERPPFASVVG